MAAPDAPGDFRIVTFISHVAPEDTSSGTELILVNNASLLLAGDIIAISVMWNTYTVASVIGDNTVNLTGAATRSDSDHVYLYDRD